MLSLNIILTIILIPIIYLFPINEKKTNIISNKKNSLYLGITGIQLLFFHALKDWSSLPDLLVYEDLFLSYNNTSQNGFETTLGFEIGYCYLNYLVNLVSVKLTIFSIIISGIIIVCYLYIIKKYSPLVWLSVILFCCLPYLQSLFVIRQHIAVALCFATIPFILNRRLILFLITVLIAISIHTTAVVFLPAYWIYNIPINKKWYINLIITIPVVYVGLRIIIDFISSKFGLYESHINGNDDGGTNATPALIALFVVAIGWICSNPYYYKGITKLSFLMTCISLTLCISGIGLPLIPRLNLYTSIFYILYLPLAISKTSYNNRIIIVPLTILFFILLYFSTLNRGFFEDFRLII